MKNTDTSTRAERIIAWSQNHRWLSIIFILAAILTPVATVIGFPKQIIESWEAIKAFRNPPLDSVVFSADDLDSTSNPRFGFSFLYPKTWDRRDPGNGDGNAFFNPKNGNIKLLAWGHYKLEEIISNEALQDYRSELPGFRLIEEVDHGMWLVDTKEENGKSSTTRMELPGKRVKYEYEEAGQKVTVLEINTEFGSTSFEIQCVVPSSLYPAYEDLCLTLVDSLHVLGKNSAPSAREADCRNDFIPGCE